MKLDFRVDLNAHHIGLNLFNNGGSVVELRDGMLKQKSDDAKASMLVGYVDGLMTAIRAIALKVQ